MINKINKTNMKKINNKKILSYIFLFIMLLSFVFLSSCDMSSLYDNDTKKTAEQGNKKEDKNEHFYLDIAYLYTNELREVTYGESVTLNSTSEKEVYWTIDGQIVSYDKQLNFIAYTPCIIEENECRDNEKTFIISCFKVLDKQTNKYKLVSYIANPNNLDIKEYGFVLTENCSDKKYIYDWTDLKEYNCSDIKNGNEFEFDLENEVANFAFASFVVTNNGTNKNPVKVYHYSNISTGGQVND